MHMRLAAIGNSLDQVAAILERTQTVHDIACLSPSAAALARQLGFKVFEFAADSDGIAAMVELVDMVICYDRSGAIIGEVIERADEHGKPCKFMVDL